MHRFFALVIAILAGLVATDHARAAARLTVLATDPPGDVVSLGRNQNFYLRIAYQTDQPVHIWARPFYQGREVKAGSNPSGIYTGSGEALGWFFLMDPADQVDEIRISAGDGSARGTPVVASYPVEIVGSEQPANAHMQPSWVTELSARDAAEQRAAYEKRMSEPPSAGEFALFGFFMLAVYGLGLASFALPAWALWRWRGGWRVAAVVPAVLIAFVVLRIGIDTSADPTSHNLWPFEILEVGVLALVIMAALFLARRYTSAHH